MKKIIFIIAWALVATGCNNSAEQNNNIIHPGTENLAEIRSSAEDLFGKKWSLYELNGQLVVLDTTLAQQPYLIFEKENRIGGYLGCNGFGGHFERQENSEIRFFDIAATEMACPNLEVEQNFFDVLNNAKSFRIENNTLVLNNDKEEIAAKLSMQQP